MKRMRLALMVMWIIVVLAAVLAGCDNSPAPSPRMSDSADDTLRFDIYNPIVSLNRAAVDGTGAVWIFSLLHGYLVIPREDGSLEPGLARSWHYDPETFTWHIDLRRDATFHDGLPVRAEDVLFSLKTIIAKFKPHVLDTVDMVVATQNTSVTIVLKKDDPDFLVKIRDMEILPSHIPTQKQVKRPIGAGPYCFREQVANSRVVLEAYKGFYNGCPQIPLVIYEYIPNQERSWGRLIQGKTDIALRITPRNYKMMKYLKNRYHITRSISRYNWILLYNTKDVVLGDPSVRRAIAYGIDRKRIVSKILMGYGRVATSPLSADLIDGQPNVLTLAYDPARGRRLLEETGWKINEADGLYCRGRIPLRFTLMFPNENPIERRVAEWIKLTLFDLGVAVQLQPVSIDQVTSAYCYNNRFQCVLTALRSQTRSNNALIEEWMPNESGVTGTGNFRSPRLEDILSLLLKPAFDGDREDLYRQAGNLLQELQPATYLFQKDNLDVVSDRISLPYTFSCQFGPIHRLYQARLQ